MSPKAVAIAVTEYYGPFYDDGRKTGAYFSEVYHPWKVFTDAGFEVQLISESGKFGWDDGSVSSGVADPKELAVLNDSASSFNKFTSEIKSVKDVSAKDFGVAYAAGGHGTIFDFDGHTPGLYQFFADVYAQGGLATAVCHGPTLFGFVKGPDGKLLIDGKKVTGFPDAGETLFNLDGTLERTGKKRVTDFTKTAIWVEPKSPLEATVVQDGRILTGANPASAAPLAEAIVEQYNKL